MTMNEEERKKARSLVAPLALAQFTASYAGSNMNVAISSIATDLDTSVRGVQTAITLFTLTMAALMIPGSKLTDIWGRKRCFVIGMVIYGSGALLAASAGSLGVLVLGYSLLEGVGSALMIPPIYILITVWFTNVADRARYFGIISGAAGAGAAAGPLIGGFVTSAISWRASFLLQVCAVGYILYLSRRIPDVRPETKAPFDLPGAVLSAAGLCSIVIGVLMSGTYGWLAAREDFTIAGFTVTEEGGISPVWLLIVIGVGFLMLFFRHTRKSEEHDRQPLLSTRLLRNRVSNLGLITQNLQWLVLQGSFFVVSVSVQTINGYNAIETGLVLSPAIVGMLVASSFAERMAKRRSQTLLIRGGFATTAVGMGVLLLCAELTDNSVVSYIPGLFLMGSGLGVMLTASVNVVQSSWPEKDQGEISGLSRSVSNLGSSLGTAIVGSVIASPVIHSGRHFGIALAVTLVITLIGFVTALLLPSHSRSADHPDRMTSDTKDVGTVVT
jgi:MFS family permease